MHSEGKVVFVSGASRGIGCAIAQEFAKQGAIVLGSATTEQGAKRITALISEMGAKGRGVCLNLRDKPAISQVINTVSDEYGSPDILVNNAAVTHDNLFMRMKEEEWQQVLDTNLTGLFHLTQACIKPMVKKRWGRVISITSIVGVTGNPGQANYCAAKAGVIGFTKSLAQELASRNITFNCVAPGFIDTDMTRSLNEKQQEAILSQIPMQRMGSADDIAKAVNFLASDAASYITGQTLHVNGGMCMI